MNIAGAITRRNPRYGRIFKAVWSGAAARVLSSIVGLLSLPLAVRYLGAERYGLWATVATTTVWINVLDLGIANTLTNHISRAHALHDKQAARRYFTNAVAMTLLVTLVASGLFAWIASRIDWVSLLNVGPQVSPKEVRRTVLVAGALMLLGLPCNLSAKVLAGYQELHRCNYTAAIGTLGSLAGLTLGVLLRVPMSTLYLMSVGCLTFAGIGTLIMVLWQKPWLLPEWRLIDFDCIRELLGSGSAFFLIQVAAVVVFSSDNVIVSHYLGAAEVTPYSVTWRLAGLAAVLQFLIFPALWPAYAEAFAKREYDWIRRTFATMMKGIGAVNIACALILVLFGRTVIRVWAGAAAVPSYSLVLAMSAWIVVNGFMSVESCLLAALNRVRAQAFLSIAAAGVNVALSVMLVQRMGALGVISGTLLSYLFVLVVPQSLIVRGALKKDLAEKPQPPKGILEGAL